jgi:hypothetical protein
MFLRRQADQAVLVCFILALAGTIAGAQTNDQLREIWRNRDFERMEEVARTGDARAQAWLGLMFQNEGRYAEALQWWTAAAEQGNLWAIEHVAFMYERGLGTQRSLVAATAWHRRGAELGGSSAQTRYAHALLRGEGVPKDAEEAVRWFSAAAKNRDKYAYLPLAELYEAGIGVRRDPVEAWALAAVGGLVADSSDTTAERRSSALQNRLEKELTDEQEMLAIQRARSWDPDYDSKIASRKRGDRILTYIGLLVVAFLVAIVAWVVAALWTVLRASLRMCRGSSGGGA